MSFEDETTVDLEGLLRLCGGSKAWGDTKLGKVMDILIGEYRRRIAFEKEKIAALQAKTAALQAEIDADQAAKEKENQ